MADRAYQSRRTPRPARPETETGPLTADELRRLATYLQYRLDRASAESGDMKLSQEIVERMIVVIEAAQKSLRPGLRDTAA